MAPQVFDLGEVEFSPSPDSDTVLTVRLTRTQSDGWCLDVHSEAYVGGREETLDISIVEPTPEALVARIEAGDAGLYLYTFLVLVDRHPEATGLLTEISRAARARLHPWLEAMEMMLEDWAESDEEMSTYGALCPDGPDPSS